MTPVMGLLRDSTEGIKTGVIAGLTQFVCYKLNEPLRFTFGCCGGQENSHGCKNSFACCRTAPEAPGCMYTYPCCSGGPQAVGCTRKFLCCGKQEGVTGCEVVCKKCEKNWGTAAGECYKKQHELRKIKSWNGRQMESCPVNYTDYTAQAIYLGKYCSPLYGLIQSLYLRCLYSFVRLSRKMSLFGTKVKYGLRAQI